ncbi:acetate--CoA ligase family protein [Desulforhopalus singaporensis]|uniref:Acyl-CoA synthetase (NDP forming) n=1 Tax=Desulforhopalus singaporensis TaxID=91360 RepID=A0A1H0TPC6_9BACT|nr:acetate--CoA ligase family protein [Desulforhopalus singaporensis]SDP55874.1 Acyl-CoA synthetase (NDP forming) [Desulforhopalus singaporensis]
MHIHIDYPGLTSLLKKAASEGRNFLFEYEVYHFVELIGGDTTPHYYFLPTGARMNPAELARLPGEKVVVKVVSPEIIHKSDVGGVAICSKNEKEVLSTIRKMSVEVPKKIASQYFFNHNFAQGIERDLQLADYAEAVKQKLAGFLVCQFIESGTGGFGNELLIGLRNTREFGTIIIAGLGGTDTQLYADSIRRDKAVTSCGVDLVDGQTFFRRFQKTISYRKLAGMTRGGRRIVTNEQLLECFSAMIEAGRYFSSSNTATPYTIEEFEVNPFAFSNFLMTPLDGVCAFSTRKTTSPPRPTEKIDLLLHPETIAVAGVSQHEINIGRIILNNILAHGFARDKITVIHPVAGEIEGLATVPDVESLPWQPDLLILAISGPQLSQTIESVIQKNLAATVILVADEIGPPIPRGKSSITSSLREKIANYRLRNLHPPVFLGGNSLGVLSNPGNYDAMFIPDTKLPKKKGDHLRSSVFVSQSGAYMITRMSKLAFLDPAYAISVGNQTDLTAGDFLHYLNSVDFVKTLAFYIEGFNDLDGIVFAKEVERAISLGKEVILYKAGRTQEGKDALSGHTASIAGDYMVCQSCITQAGAIVAETFNIFEGLLRLSTSLGQKRIRGNRLAAISNAGYESVGIADNILGEDYRLQMAVFSRQSATRLQRVLDSAHLGSLVSVHNPLDITPMSSEDIYIDTINILLADPNIDILVVAIVPLTPMLHTLPEELHPSPGRVDSSIISNISTINNHTDKPIILVLDSGRLYDPFADELEQAGLPVFRSADLCILTLGKYVQARLTNRTGAANQTGSVSA